MYILHCLIENLESVSTPTILDTCSCYLEVSNDGGTKLIVRTPFIRELSRICMECQKLTTNPSLTHYKLGVLSFSHLKSSTYKLGRMYRFAVVQETFVFLVNILSRSRRPKKPLEGDMVCQLNNKLCNLLKLGFFLQVKMTLLLALFYTSLIQILYMYINIVLCFCKFVYYLPRVQINNIFEHFGYNWYTICKCHLDIVESCVHHWLFQLCCWLELFYTW